MSTLCRFWRGLNISVCMWFQGLWLPRSVNKASVSKQNIQCKHLPTSEHWVYQTKDFENWHICFISKQINDRLGLLGCTSILFTFPRIALNKRKQPAGGTASIQTDSWDDTSISKIFSWSDSWNLKQARLTKNFIRWCDCVDPLLFANHSVWSICMILFSVWFCLKISVLCDILKYLMFMFTSPISLGFICEVLVISLFFCVSLPWLQRCFIPFLQGNKF